MFRIVRATLLLGMVSFAAVAATPPVGAANEVFETPDQAYAAALRASVGAPARADLDDQATIRLSDDLLLIPRDTAARLLTVSDRSVPDNLTALLLDAQGMDAAGIIRFVPAGFVDSDAALAWTADDMLSSLRDTIERGNPARVKANLPEREVRRWISAPRYDPESHQISWAALILPKSAPGESDGEITYNAIRFGREGYVRLSIVTSVQQAGGAERMANLFLAGLNFRPGKGYSDVLPTDRRSPGGLAATMGVDSLHRARPDSTFLAGDTVVPTVGAIVASIGALSLLIYIQRFLRHRARRV